MSASAQRLSVVMQMEEGLDTGPVHRMLATPIGPLETSGELFERLAPLGGALLAAFLGDLPAVPAPTAQDEARMTLAPMLSKAEGLTDWTCSMSQVIDHVRGMDLDPWPGAFTGRGEQTLKLFRAGPSSRSRPEDTRPGQVLCACRGALSKLLPRHGLVACRDTSVDLTVLPVPPHDQFTPIRKPLHVVGADGCKHGWVAVRLVDGVVEWAGVYPELVRRGPVRRRVLHYGGT